MDELIDILDSEGNLTGQTTMKSAAHQKGLFHQTVHVWFYTSDGKVLIQQRGKNKDTHPLLWDVSVAGHIGAGESIETAALREVEEEIGLRISTDELQKIGYFPSFFRHREDLIDNEFRHTFKCELKEPLESLKKQENEVEALELIPVHKFKIELNEEESLRKYVPHETKYYHLIIAEVQKAIRIQ